MGSEKNPKTDNGENEEEREEFLHPFSASDAEDNFNGELSTSKSYSNYRSAMTTLSSASSEHPLFHPSSVATTPVVSDPLLFPPHNPSLDSPSYANVMSHPFHDRLPESNGNGEISGEVTDSSPRSQSSSSDYLSISVSDPLKESEPLNSIVPGANTYISYLIATSTNIADYEGTPRPWERPVIAGPPRERESGQRSRD